MNDPKPPLWKTLAAFAVLYIVWGSTYLAMRIAVETLPPFTMAGARFLAAGCVLYLWARRRGDAPPTRDHVRTAVIAGALLLLLGNGLVMWSVTRIPSGVAALLVALTPIWLTVFARERVSTLVVVGLGAGLLGVVILIGPSSFAGADRVDPVGAGAVVIGSLSWALGSLVQRGGRSHPSPFLSSALQMLCGGVLLLVAGVLLREPWTTSFGNVTARSVGALVYLALFGSLLGFTSYAWLLQHAPAARVATYAYVNPVVAVALGALFAGEPLSGRVLVAAAVIIAGVVAIVGGSRGSAAPRPPPEVAPVRDRV